MRSSKIFGDLLLCFVSLTAEGLAQQPAARPGIANAWMRIPTPYSVASSGVPSALRQARDLYWDSSAIAAPTQLTPETASASGVSSEAFSITSPEIPRLANRVIATATFVNHISVLTASGRAVYTEGTFHVHDVYETIAGSPARDSDITIALPGGAVVMPSGRILYYLAQPRELFLQPGRKYLLILSHHASGDFYTVGEDWDLTSGRVQPNTFDGRTLQKTGHSSLSGLAADQVPSVLSRLLAGGN